MTVGHEEPNDYYDETSVEADRLSRTRIGRLEFLRTQELLRRWLPAPPGDVLDVGGGTGVHAVWLTGDGYRVHVIDPVDAHVAAVRDRGIAELTASIGDARSLVIGDSSVDVVLLLGPLYHLIEHTDRRQALAEAYRVLRPGGVVAAAAISRHCVLVAHARNGTLTEDLLPRLLTCMATGYHDPSIGFTTAHMHYPEELTAEVRLAGFTEVSIHAVEGPAFPALPRREEWSGDDADPVLRGALLCAREIGDDPRLLAVSPHLLAFGRKPTG